MQVDHPLFLTACLFICRLVSHMLASIHYYSVYIGMIKIPACFSSAPGGIYYNLQKIWFSRLLRRVVSVLMVSPLRLQTLRLVNFSVPVPKDSGCVIATFHTPWAKILVQCCLENDFALFIAKGKWTKRANRINNHGKGYIELRQLIKHLRCGGRVIIMADCFNNETNCTSKFFEKDCNISLLPARLARIAKVPLLAVVPGLSDENINISAGPLNDLKMLNTDTPGVMKDLILFFETEIRRAPYLWSRFVCNSLSNK